MKKIVLLALVFVMIVTLCVACTKKKPEKIEDVKTPEVEVDPVEDVPNTDKPVEENTPTDPADTQDVTPVDPDAAPVIEEVPEDAATTEPVETEAPVVETV